MLRSKSSEGLKQVAFAGIGAADQADAQHIIWLLALGYWNMASNLS
jgi:hypothetical protein